MIERVHITDEGTSGSVHHEYEPPELSVLGSFEELTQGGGGGTFDCIENSEFSCTSTS